MTFDFDTAAVRKGTGSMKYAWLPEGWGDEGLLTFSGAEIDMKTAPCIIEALISRAQNGLYGYTLADDRYLSSVIFWMKSVREWDVSKEWIVPTYGTIQALNCAIRAFTEPGDKVLIQPPTYHSYKKATENNGRICVENALIAKEGVYYIDYEDLENKMKDPRVKLMVLCNPQNPIMDIWGKADLQKIADLAREYEVVVFSDEIFAEHSYEGIVESFNKTCPEMSIVTTSMGKAFNFTGLSHANAIISNETLRERFRRQRDIDHYGSLDPFIYAAQIAAYTPDGKAWIDALLKYANENRKILREFFEQNFPQVSLYRQRGGTLQWMDLSGLGMEEEALHRFLQDEAKIQTDKGSMYGTGGYCFTRIEYATPRQILIDALDRLYAASKRRGLIVG